MAKRQWVYRKLVEKDALTGPPVVKHFAEGEGFAYLGRSYRLTLTPKGPKFALIEAGSSTYCRSGSRRNSDASLVHRCRQQVAPQQDPPLAARLGEQSVGVEVRDLGFRWAQRVPTQVPNVSISTGPSSNFPQPYRLRPSSRTRPPARGQSHPRILVHRGALDAGIQVREVCPCLHRQKYLVRYHYQMSCNDNLRTWACVGSG